MASVPHVPPTPYAMKIQKDSKMSTTSVKRESLHSRRDDFPTNSYVGPDENSKILISLTWYSFQVETRVGTHSNRIFARNPVGTLPESTGEQNASARSNS